MSTPESNKPRATPDQVFAFAARVATEVYSWELPGKVIQAAKDQTDHSVWTAIKNALNSQPDTTQVAQEEVVRSRIEVLYERPKPCAQRSPSEQVDSLKGMYTRLKWRWTESGPVIPMHQRGFDRLIVLADPELTNNRVYDVCSNSFPSWRYTSGLNSAIPVENDQRHPSKGPYAIWVRDQYDLDPDLLGLSADQIAERGLNTMTLLERMILELIRFRETGEHLDRITWTLCAGSRHSGGGVPYALWDGDRFGVGWCGPDHRYPDIGARQAVTL